MTTPDGGESHVASPDAASEKIRIQAERGDASAQLALGSAFAARREFVEARSWYNEVLNNTDAARDLIGQAFAGLASISRDDPLSDQRREELYYYRHAAEFGNANAQFHLGRIHANMGNPADDEIAVHWFRNVAEHDVRAALALGRMVETGRGVARDGQQAATWYERALERACQSVTLPDLLPTMIEHGFANPYFLKGLMHDYGWTIARDDAKAAYCYRKAFEEHSGCKADAGASAQLDAHYATGDVEWLHQAAASGLAEAQYLLGRRHLGSKDAFAVFWFLKAAEQGDLSAVIDLTVVLSKPRDQSIADQIRRAALDFRERGLLTAREAHQKIRDLLSGNAPGSTC